MAASALPTAAGARPVSKMNDRAVLIRCSTTGPVAAMAPPCEPSDFDRVKVRTTSPARTPAAEHHRLLHGPAPDAVASSTTSRALNCVARSAEFGKRRQITVDAEHPRR